MLILSITNKNGLKTPGIYFIILFLLITESAAAQDPASLSNLRSKIISTTPAFLQIDTLSIVPNTLTIPGIPPGTYELDAVNAILRWKQKPATEKVTITYRVFPYKLNAVTKRLNYDSVRYNFLIQLILCHVKAVKKLEYPILQNFFKSLQTIYAVPAWRKWLLHNKC